MCKALLPTLSRHFLNIERPRGDSTASISRSGRASEVKGAGRPPDCDTPWNWPGGGASSSWGSEEGVGDSDSAVSTRKQEKNVTITYLFVVELMNCRARRRLGLCHCEKSPRVENERTDTSRRSSPSTLCPSVTGRLGFIGCSCCTYTVMKSARLFSDGMAKFYRTRVRWFAIVIARCRRLLVSTFFIVSRCLCSLSPWQTEWGLFDMPGL